MRHTTARLLYWTPRILSILYAAFLSIFALDVLSEPHGFWLTTLAFFIHLIPTMGIIAMLLIAWRWDWIGAGLFTLAAAAYAWHVLPGHIDWAAWIAGPLLEIAALFLVSGMERYKLRSPL